MDGICKDGLVEQGGTLYRTRRLIPDVIAGNAKLQGLTTQLHLTGDKYNIALVSLCLAQVQMPEAEYVICST